jgi:tetratricopeptide (TPR) repeat protein
VTPPERKGLAARGLALFLLALGVRALHLHAMRGSLLFEALSGDGAQYDRWAQRIAGGDWIGSEVFYQTPLYPYAMGALYRALGHDPDFVRGAQALLGALSCLLLARAGARFFGERAGWLAGLLVALYPPAIFFDGILQKASLDLVLMSALLWIVSLAQEKASAARILGTGFALGALILNRENAAALVPVLVAWAAWLARRRGAVRALAGAVLVLVGLAAALVPVGLRNRHVGGIFLLTTSQMGSNFWIGNHRGADGGYVPMRAGRGDAQYERDDVRRIAEDAVGHPLTPAEVSRYWMARAFADIRSAPLEWVRLLAWKAFLTFNRVELVDGEAIGTHARHSPALAAPGWLLHFGVLVPLAVLGAWWTRRSWRRIWVLHAMTVTFAVAVTFFFVFARYRYPLVPLAALFAGAGLAELPARLRGIRSGGARVAAVGLALAVAVAIFANWPVPQKYDDDAVTFYNAGTALLDAGRLEDALALLERARDADPSFPETWNNLGRTELARGDFDAARRAFERGVELAPDHAILHLNLAAATSRAGDAPRTRVLLERAIALDPLLVAAYGPLAELEMRAGNVERAVALLRRRVELTPDSAVARADLATGWIVSGRMAEAVAELRAALRLDPALGPVRRRLAWILATSPDPALRNGAEAVALIGATCGSDCAETEALQILAAAQAAAGDPGRAADTAQRAIDRAQAEGRTALAEVLARQQAAYRSGGALTEAAPRLSSPR